ncbi:esterase family protein [Thalassotalea litorea]|uniref:Esterase family protein n=1 Tax=Thalassotalea litorea TaxID=2020715 RepID=A0A5R9IKY4_9GAMM|nr:alpha/beta hydrolase-fold protein [Thalassotalea litorea]TLU66184.1 esterase family protein [Thalassotalea litorea]
MNKLSFYSVVLLATAIFLPAVSNAGDRVASGSLDTVEAFSSNYVKSRRVQVWKPEGYSQDTKYAVLYMHDGQMLFDSNTTWNKQEWGVDETATALIKEKKIRPFIVVGIDNIKDLRHSEYFPQKPFESLTENDKQRIYKAARQNGNSVFSNQVISDQYLKFLVYELKPYIDKTYSVHTDKDNTFVMGSSMGGLISAYAMMEYPSVFGGAACLSTHWPGIFTMTNNPIPLAFYQYLDGHLPSPNSHKIYFDHGDQTLDAMYPDLQKEVDKIMVKNGYTQKNWQTHVYPGDAHSENAWRKRLNVPLTFLLGQ